MDLISAMAEREDITELEPLPEAVRLPAAIKQVVVEARDKSNGEMIPLLQDIIREAQAKGDDLSMQKEVLVRGVVARAVTRMWLLRCLKSANVHKKESGVADWTGPSWTACEKYLREMEEHAAKRREQLQKEAMDAQAAAEVYAGASEQAEREAAGVARGQ